MLSVLLLAAQATTYRFPAEWEPQQSVWMSWSTYDNKRGLSVHRVQRDIIEALHGAVRVDLLVRNAQEERDARRWLRKEDHVRFHRSANAEIWMRDFGPIFLKSAEGKLAVADFRFDFWGYLSERDPMSRSEEAVDRNMGRKLGLPLRRSSLVSEGGNREFNGKGTLMVVEAVEMRRNPGKLRDEIEAELKRVFEVTNVIWLKRGVAEDDMTSDGPLPGRIFTVITTGGHVDNVARFIGPRRIVVAETTAEEAKSSPIARMSRERYLENLKILQAARDQDGRPFDIVKMPSPVLVPTTLGPGDSAYDFIRSMKFKDGTVIRPGERIRVAPAASYMNFLISNGRILTTRMWRPGMPAAVRQRDAEAQAVLRNAFPGYRIIPIETEAVNLGGGGIHCITQQMPVAGK